MLEELKEDVFISQELRYFDVTNIFFDAPLNKEQIEELKQIIFSINNISQIYFRKDIDIKTIEAVKYLLEISPTMEDARVEKYIIEAKNLDLNKLCDINFFNPSTWYLKDYSNYDTLISIDKYKELNNLLNKVIFSLDLGNYSTIEKVAKIYDWCKSLTLKSNVSDDVLNALKTKCTNSIGYSKIFKILLEEIGINSFIGKSIVEGAESSVVIADIKDEKYDLSGVYLFDPLSDYISLDEVPDKSLRFLNYNYFAILLRDYSKTIFSDKLIGVINTLTHDLEYDLEKLRFISKSDIIDLEKSLDDSFLSIHKRIENTKEISEALKLDILCTINKKEFHDIIIQNYKLRRNKLLNYEI